MPIRPTIWRKLRRLYKSNLSETIWLSIVLCCGSCPSLWFIPSSSNCPWTIFHLATLLNVALVALVFGYTVSLKLQVYFDLSYQNTLKLSLSGFLWAYLRLPGFTQVCTPCRSWLLLPCSFCRSGMWPFLYQWYVGTCYESIHEKIGDKIEWSSSGFTLSYRFMVWLWSWSLPVLRLCYRMLTGTHVKKPNRLQNDGPTTRTVSEVEYYHRGVNRQNLWLNQAHMKEFTSISVSAHQTTSIGN